MNIMGLFMTFIPILISVIVTIGIIILIITWVNKFIRLKEEQNDLLREIIKKLDR